MEILFVSVWFPFPLSNGSRIRVNHLLRALSRKNRVHLIAFLPPEVDRQAAAGIRGICANVDWVERDPFWRDPRQKLSAHFSVTPRDVLRGYSTEMAELVKRIAREKNFDVIIASTIEAAPYVVQVAHPKRVLEEHNFTTLWMEERYHNQHGLLNRAAGWITWQKCRRYERGLYPRFKAVTMVSENDLRAVHDHMPQYPGRLAVIPNGVDLQTHRMRMAEPQLDTIVFNGSIKYAANMEAVRWFVDSVWPIIQKQRPGTRLAITGDFEGLDLRWLTDDPLIRLTGYLEDICPVVAGSWLAIAPLRSGGGTRLKILEAMALGTPVVATGKGAEGLNVSQGENILIAEDPTDFALQSLQVLENPALRSELASKARQLVELNYSWEMIGEKFCELVEQIEAAPPIAA